MKGDGMREIKFRVYDKGRKQWVHDTDHAISLFGEYVIFGEILRRPDDSIVSLDELNDLDAMQYTGLKDRNGKEIYEGDILLLANGITVPVYHDSGAFWAGAVLLLTEDKSSVVIGNKWENPELDPDQ